MTPAGVVRDYHQRTKHHFHRFAAAADSMDWATQPDPFRRFRGAPLHKLPLPPEGDPLPYDDLFRARLNAPRALELGTISRFLRWSLGLTAWKEVRGSRWALRANPSSGNLHPTEGYLVLPPIAGLHSGPALWHYAPREHGLERRADLEPGVWQALAAGWPEGAFLVALSSIHWREAWKYGERAYRYCQHDVGHALGALAFAAASLGWRLRRVDALGDGEVEALLGLDREADFVDAEREHPDLAVLVWPLPGSTADDDAAPLATAPVPAAIEAVRGSIWYGQANRLSSHHSADWPIIASVAAASVRPRTAAATWTPVRDPPHARLAAAGGSTNRAEAIVLGRRSAVRYDGKTSLASDRFFAMLARTLPGGAGASPPFAAWPERPRIHLGLFVHRVDGLDPGLYLLPRDERARALLRAELRPEFAFVEVPGCPSALPLVRLRTGDVRALSSEVSCGQDIAGDGAFSLGMLAELEDGLAARGPWGYRELFWESGLIGQVLYLEAEDAGIRATGIGCYFDDPVHEVFGIRGTRLQSLYHFTMGGAVEDRRLTSLPAYPAPDSTA